MPELPEVEHLRRSLEPFLIGADVCSVQLKRRDIVRDRTSKAARRIVSASLLAGCRIQSLHRHGKNMSIIAECGRVLCVHLGMSGQMCFVAAGERMRQTTHVHCVWKIQSHRREGRLIFRDPRRFGGLWAFDSLEALQHVRLHNLGPDALTISVSQLQNALTNKRTSIKAVLLNQAALAGIGNIYADESLFKAKIHPAAIACNLSAANVKELTRAIRMVLKSAINSGGSSIRSYVDGNGVAGTFSNLHRVYGRGGKPCPECGQPLAQTSIAQRTTVYCLCCQPTSR